MITWSGKGYRAILLFIVLLILGIMIIPEMYSDYSFICSLCITGIFSFIYGTKWNKEDSGIGTNVKTGEKKMISNPHTLFGLPLQYFGFIFPLLGSIILFQNSIIAGIVVGTLLSGLLVLYILQQRKLKASQPQKRTSDLPQNENQSPSTSKNKEAMASNERAKMLESIERVKNSESIQTIDLSKMTPEELAAYHKKFMPS